MGDRLDFLVRARAPSARAPCVDGCRVGPRYGWMGFHNKSTNGDIRRVKVLSWNVNRAGLARRLLWETIRREDPDIALLQEVGALPSWVSEHYACHLVTPRYFGGQDAPFSTGALSKWPVETSSFLSSEFDWVNTIHLERPGWIVECRVGPEMGNPVHVVSVHSPAFPVPRRSLVGVDTSVIKLKNNRDVWFTEILLVPLVPCERGRTYELDRRG